MHINRSSKLLIIELDFTIVVTLHCSEKVVTNLEVFIWEEERGSCEGSNFLPGSKKLIP